ncbi:RNA recognition motif domain-containing protein [Luteolibacter sp. AS25]|uniref:RNA recognition motif domain-containing protein n=1 Tax=Luteolibacter sp. AS25 TaxID=3135776 RepID=UPI00398B862D
MQILVRNLDRQITEPELLELFEDFGKVTACSLVMDPKTGLSKGFGFVDMPKLDEANNAIKKLDRLKMGGTSMRVKRAAHSTVHKGKSKGV